MGHLKIKAIADDTPVKLSVVLPAAVHRDLVSYADALNNENGGAIEPVHLIGPMLAKFMATDRGFARWRRNKRADQSSSSGKRELPSTQRDDSMDR